MKLVKESTIGTSKNPIEENCLSQFGGKISVGQEVVYVTLHTKRFYFAKGIYRGKVKTPYRWAPDGYATTYVVEREDGRTTRLQYARMLPVGTDISALVGKRL